MSYSEESFAPGKRPGQGIHRRRGAIEAATVLAAWKLEKSRHKAFRLCGHDRIGIETLTDVDRAIHNFRNLSGPMK